MLNPLQCETVYAFMNEYEKNPRIAVKELHKRCSPYRGVSTTTALLTKAKDTQVFIGPRIFMNAHIDVSVIYREEMSPNESVEIWNATVTDSTVTYAVLLSGAHTLIVFRKGATVLTYAEAVKPSYPAKKRLEEIAPVKREKLPRELYPNSWDDLDWKVYQLMKHPLSLSYREAGAKLGVSWVTVRDHFLKILRDCKPWNSFFPRGLPNYYHSFLTFETDYEVGIRDELAKLDRSSFLYRCGKMMILYICCDDQKAHYRFHELEKEGIIHDARVSIPIQWSKPDVLV